MRKVLIVLLLSAVFAFPLAAKELTGTLQQIDKSGKINIGYRHDKPPMSFLDKTDGPSGYSIDICEQIVTAVEKKLGKDIETKYVQVSVDERFNALADNKIDILCGATTKTLSRGETVDFTLLTFITGASFISLEKNETKNSSAVGKKIGVVNDTTTLMALKEILTETQTDSEIVIFDSTAAAMNALNKEEIDAFSADQIVLIGLSIASENPRKYKIISNIFSYEPFALAVKRNDADFRLVADRVIAGLFGSRKILTIYDQWVGKFTGQRPSAFDGLMKLNALPE